LEPEEELMDRIKGSIFIFFVKIIRRAKDERLMMYLTEEDKEIIAGRIFPSSWYPIDTFWRCLKAFYEVFGQRKPKECPGVGKGFRESDVNEYL
jgi:NDP-sugar pyrophosphorylase family protein